MAGPLSLVRRMEHLHRGDRRPRKRLGAGQCRRLPARSQAPARTRHPRERTPPHGPRQQRGEPRIGRRHGAGVADSAGRRAGNRQIDPFAAARAGGERTQDALCFGRGVGRADQDARGTHRHRQRRMSDLSRNAARKHRQPDRRTPARSGGDRLDTDHLHRPAGLVGGKRVADTRMRGDAAQIRQIDRHVDLHHRPHHQGRNHRRTQDSGTYRGRGAAVRGRQQQHIPHPARHQEPFRRDVRNRGFRDARQRTARRGQPVGDSAHALRGAAERHRGRRFGRWRAPLPDRGAGAGERRGVRHAAAYDHGLRHQAHEHAAGRAGEARGNEDVSERRLPELRRRIQGRRSGAGPRGRGGGDLLLL